MLITVLSAFQNHQCTFIFVILPAKFEYVKALKSSNIVRFLHYRKIQYLEIHSLECVGFSLYLWSDLHLIPGLYQLYASHLHSQVYLLVACRYKGIHCVCWVGSFCNYSWIAHAEGLFMWCDKSWMLS